MWEYTDKVKEHFLNPRNVGKVEGANGVAEVGSMACGDAMKLTIKVEGHQERGHRGGTENTAGIVGLGRACAP